MMIECFECKKLYDEKDPQQVTLHECGCEVLCYNCIADYMKIATVKA